MARYIMLMNWTDDGIRNVKDSPKRQSAAVNLCRKHGAELVEFYMTLGSYDMVGVVEAPDDETFARIALTISMGGAIRSTSLKAFDVDQYRSIIDSLG